MLLRPSDHGIGAESTGLCKLSQRFNIKITHDRTFQLVRKKTLVLRSLFQIRAGDSWACDAQPSET